MVPRRGGWRRERTSAGRSSVTPDGDGAVTIVLPETTDCDAAGAVCTGDGRMLSSQDWTLDRPGSRTDSPGSREVRSFNMDQGATGEATLRASDGDTPASRPDVARAPAEMPRQSSP